MNWADLAHAAEIVVPIVLFMWADRNAAKRQLNEKHEENRKKFEEILSERAYLVPHDHLETAGPLTVNGIIRRRNGTK